MIESLGDGSAATGESTARVQFIDSFFPATYCTFEKIQIQRFFYFLIFNISCSISQIFCEDEEWQRYEQVKECESNQKEINELIKQIYEKYKGEKFVRKPLHSKSGPMSALSRSIQQELMIERKVITSGITRDSATRRDKFWKGIKFIITLAILFFLIKN